MRIEPSQTEIGIVFVGSFNPAIFNPDWFLRQNLVGEDAYEDSEVELTSPEYAKFKIGAFDIIVVRTKLQLSIRDYPYVQIMDLAVNLMGDLLPHSMVSQLGINLSVHFKVGEARRHAIGRLLAPAEPWGEWSAEWENNPQRARSGLLNTSLIELHLDDPDKRQTTANVQPSYFVPHNNGIFVGINDQFDVSDQTGRGAAKIINARFEESIKRSEWIVDQVMALKDKVDVK